MPNFYIELLGKRTMTALSVNLNKIAWLRNSRDSNYPNVCEFAKKFIELGVKGITVHPRPDERHIKRQDVWDLSALLNDYPEVEFNIEGNPTEDFLELVEAVKPHQCTLVPDSPDQLTSDHGWDVVNRGEEVKAICQRIQAAGVRVSIFLDPDMTQAEQVAATGTDRIELYTESFAKAYPEGQAEKILQDYAAVSAHVQAQGLGVNAGHDLNLDNLSLFLTIPNILEVSIGHALTVECLEQGIVSVTEQYLKICQAGA
jgi:pyridoxine 5-phosphate synthase